MSDKRTARTIAMKRTSALAIDYIMVSSLVLLPIAFNLMALPKVTLTLEFARKLGTAIAHDYVVAIALILLLTPLPIIYWRVFFKIFMHLRTPGEQIMAVNNSAKWVGIALWANETGYGLMQYIYVLSSVIFGTIAFYVSIYVVIAIFQISRINTIWLFYWYFYVWPIFIFHALFVWHNTKFLDAYEAPDAALVQK